MSEPVEFDVDPAQIPFPCWYDAPDIFPARRSWARLLKMFLRRPSKAYDWRYYDAPFGTYGGYEYDGRYAEAAARIVKEFNLKPGAEVLETGGAKGFILVELQKLGMRVTGIEASWYAVATAHPEVRRHMHEWRGKSLPFSTNEFDFVLCKEALPHMDDPKLMIEQIERVGKQSYLVIQVAETWWQAWLMKMWDPTHVHCKPTSWWEQLLDEAGYTGAVTFKRLF